MYQLFPTYRCELELRRPSGLMVESRFNDDWLKVCYYLKPGETEPLFTLLTEFSLTSDMSIRF